MKKPILRWDPGGAQKKWSKCPRLERPILRWDLGGAKLITALNFMLLHHVFHRNVQLYFQRRGCSNQAANMRLRYVICSFPYLNLILCFLRVSWLMGGICSRNRSLKSQLPDLGKFIVDLEYVFALIHILISYFLVWAESVPEIDR